MGNADEKRKIREAHAEFMKEQAIKKQEVVMKFKRSNDAVLKVFTPKKFNGEGCISCSADHNIKRKFVLLIHFIFETDIAF